MTEDARGLELTGSEVGARALDDTVAAYCGFRRDTGDHLKRALTADPQLVLGHVLSGYFMLLFPSASAVPRAAAALGEARKAADAAGANPRERAHIAALEQWIAGDLSGAAHRWRAILGEWPRDLVAMKLAQYGAFYLGRSADMRDATARAVAALAQGAPGGNFALGCHAFSLEECGAYDEAERLGRQAVERDPADIWATHAVAHVAEMEDRIGDGLAWIAAHESAWRDVNNFALHVHWHAALFLIAQGRAAEALARYDRAVWPKPSDEYLDIANAVSLLWRLEREGCDAGARWVGLASSSRPHQGDHRLVFADLHYLIALAGAGEDAAVAEWLEESRAYARAHRDDAARILGDVGLALAAASVAHRKRDWRSVVAAILPVRTAIPKIGGSHAQRDLFDEMLIDAALEADPPLARTLLAERLARRPRNPWALARS